MIKCIAFLWRYSPSRFLAALALTMLCGYSGIALLALANTVLQGRPISKELVIFAFVGFCVLLPLGRFAADILISRTAQQAVFELQMRLPRKIAAAPLRFLEDHGAHRLLAVLTQDLQVFGFALLTLPTTCLNLTIFAGGLAYLGWLSPMVLLIALGFIALCLVIYRFPASKAAKSLRLSREATDGLYQHLRSLLGGAKELKLHQRRRKAFLSQVLQSAASAIRAHNVSGMSASTAATAWAQTSGFVLIGALLLAIPLIKLDPQARVGYTIALVFMMATLQGVLSRDSQRDYRRAAIALQSIEDLERNLTALHAEPDSALQEDCKYDFSRLELCDVTFAYNRTGELHDFIVGPVSLALVPGEIVFLVGGNGSGKTTLAKLLAGLYSPASGEVYLNDKLVTDSNREYYRQHFSAVFADFHLFDRLLGLESAHLDEHAKNYLAQLELDHVVEVKDGILSTTKLSQGQRKRLALLTAYVEDRPIYVFDEWAADQDPSFKGTFYHSFLQELKAKGKAVLVISHDDRFYDVADRVIRLDCGSVVEAPTVAQTLRPKKTMEVTMKTISMMLFCLLLGLSPACSAAQSSGASAFNGSNGPSKGTDQKVYSKVPEANDLYIQGLGYLGKSDPWTGGKLQNARTALKLFRQAAKKDPQFALAYIGQANAIDELGHSVAGQAAPISVYRQQEAAALKAVELDDSLPQAHDMLASIYYDNEYDWPKAVKEQKRVVELTPNNVPAHTGLSIILGSLGRFEEAEAQAKLAQTIDEKSASPNRALSRILFWEHQDEASIAQGLEGLKKDSKFPPGHFYLAFVYIHQKQFDKGIEQMKLGSFGDADSLAGLAYAYAMAGNKAELQDALERLKHHPGHAFYGLAQVYVALGDKDRALSLLEKAYAERSNRMNYLKVDPTLDSLRQEPRFKQLMRKMNFEQ